MQLLELVLEEQLALEQLRLRFEAVGVGFNGKPTIAGGQFATVPVLQDHLPPFRCHHDSAVRFTLRCRDTPRHLVPVVR